MTASVVPLADAAGSIVNQFDAVRIGGPAAAA